MSANCKPRKHRMSCGRGLQCHRNGCEYGKSLVPPDPTLAEVCQPRQSHQFSSVYRHSTVTEDDGLSRPALGGTACNDRRGRLDGIVGSNFLFASSHKILSRYTPYFVGTYAIFITLETPLSRMSMNPARTFGSISRPPLACPLGILPGPDSGHVPCCRILFAGVRRHRPVLRQTPSRQ